MARPLLGEAELLAAGPGGLLRPGAQVSISCFVVVVFFSITTAMLSRKKKGMGVPRRWCIRRGSFQDGLPVKFQDVKFKDLKFKHEIFARIDMKHSYFSNFIILFAINFSVVEIIIELLVI